MIKNIIKGYKHCRDKGYGELYWLDSVPEFMIGLGFLLMGLALPAWVISNNLAKVLTALGVSVLVSTTVFLLWSDFLSGLVGEIARLYRIGKDLDK